MGVGPNVMVWQVVTGEKRWYIVGAYIAPEDEGTMETVVKAIGRRPPGAELMVAGDFNVDILAPEGRRSENIATDLATEGLEDMAQHMGTYAGPCLLTSIAMHLLRMSNLYLKRRD